MAPGDEVADDNDNKEVDETTSGCFLVAAFILD